jgi:hypothetical protein
VTDEDQLTFEDGILLCSHIYQCAIHKTLHGVIEEWDIYQKTHEMLTKLIQEQSNELVQIVGRRYDKKRLDELLFKFNMENVYAII